MQNNGVKPYIQSELQSLQEHQMWTVVQREDNSRPIPTRFIFKLKMDEEGNIRRYKARVVVKGYFQGHVDNTYSPVVEFTSIRVAITVAVQKGYHLRQLDVKTAFLHGNMEEQVFTDPPNGLSEIGVQLCKPHDVLKLHKGLYGLKKAPRIWNETWKEVISLLKFSTLDSDPCIFRRNDTWLLIYVDDIITMSSTVEAIDCVIRDLKRHVQIQDLGVLRNFLGVGIVRDSEGPWLYCRRCEAASICGR